MPRRAMAFARPLPETASARCAQRFKRPTFWQVTTQIILPPNTYLLTQVTELTITGNLTITGGGASTTIIDGNKSVRPDSGVLVIASDITVNISGVTIRNGEREEGGGIFNASM